MPQILPRPYSLRARLIFIALAVALVPFLPGATVQAQQSLQPSRAPKVTPRLGGSRAAGAYWAEPWQQGGPKILDTRRSAPPAIQVTRPPAFGFPRSPIAARPAFRGDLHARGTWSRGFQEFLGPGQFFPLTPFGLQPLGRRSFRLTLPAGRGFIWAGHGFRGSHFGFHGRGFRGRGFRGGGFRGR